MAYTFCRISLPEAFLGEVMKKSSLYSAMFLVMCSLSVQAQTLGLDLNYPETLQWNKPAIFIQDHQPKSVRWSTLDENIVFNLATQILVDLDDSELGIDTPFHYRTDVEKERAISIKWSTLSEANNIINEVNEPNFKRIVRILNRSDKQIVIEAIVDETDPIVRDEDTEEYVQLTGSYTHQALLILGLESKRTVRYAQRISKGSLKKPNVGTPLFLILLILILVEQLQIQNQNL